MHTTMVRAHTTILDRLIAHDFVVLLLIEENKYPSIIWLAGNICRVYETIIFRQNINFIIQTIIPYGRFSVTRGFTSSDP